MDKYSTHIPVFEKLFAVKNFPRILEFGLGFGSTPFLLQNCEHLTSVEMQSKDWYEKVYQSLKDNSKWEAHLAVGPNEFEKLGISDLGYDLVFVDGHGDSRPEVINRFFGKCSTIVTHDYETPSYRWHLIQKPKDYFEFVYSGIVPYTAVFTNDPVLIGAFANG